MPSPLRSIRARLTAGALLVLAAALVIGAVGAVQLLRTALTDSVGTALHEDLDTVAEQLERRPGGVDAIDDDVLVRLRGASDQVNDDDAALLPPVPDGERMRVVIDDEAYLAVGGRSDRGPLTVARSLESVDEAVTATTVVLAAAVPLVLVLVGVVLWVVAARALAPVERLRAQVDAIGAGDLHRRVDAGRDDELGALARTMNGMLERLEQSQRRQRRFVSDASHELRSPLATIRQHAELAATHPRASSLTDLSGVVLDEGARMQELVESLLLLARLDEDGARVMGPVDLDDLALAEVRRLRGVGVQVEGRGIGAARVVGDARLLARALRNLADNAVRHARSGVTIRVGEHGDRAVVQVEDDGSGIPVGQRERVFDRFARLDEARARDAGGTGLGLAIVREIAHAHHGTVQVTEGAGGGALFTLTLPRAAED